MTTLPMTSDGQRVRRWLCGVCVAAALAVSGRTALAQSPAFARTDYPSLGNDHVVADVNRDGKLDLIALWTKTAVVMLGNGDGTFQPRVEVSRRGLESGGRRRRLQP